mmetsp:Transcript_53714/g.98177  ORF Transcript_53714/g.98177 Transcript_53714/m.98177 type:complete len:201 (-) Transcript_53714:54-656(-)
MPPPIPVKRRAPSFSISIILFGFPQQPYSLYIPLRSWHDIISFSPSSSSSSSSFFFFFFFFTCLSPPSACIDVPLPSPATPFSPDLSAAPAAASPATPFSPVAFPSAAPAASADVPLAMAPAVPASALAPAGGATGAGAAPSAPAAAPPLPASRSAASPALPPLPSAAPSDMSQHRCAFRRHSGQDADYILLVREGCSPS